MAVPHAPGAEDRDARHRARGDGRPLEAEHLREADEAGLAVAMAHLHPAGRRGRRRPTRRFPRARAARSARRGTRPRPLRPDWPARRPTGARTSSTRLSASALAAIQPIVPPLSRTLVQPSTRDQDLHRDVAAVHEQRLAPWPTARRRARRARPPSRGIRRRRSAGRRRERSSARQGAGADAASWRRRSVGDRGHLLLHLRELLLVQHLEVDRRKVHRREAGAHHRVGDRLARVREQHVRACDAPAPAACPTAGTPRMTNRPACDASTRNTVLPAAVAVTVIVSTHS